MLPREKLSLWGVASLSTYELIAVVLSSGSKKKNVFEQAKEVEKRLRKSDGEFRDFSQIDGIGRIKSMKLACALELGIRLNSKEASAKRILTSEQAYETLKGIGGYKQEHFVCVYLNARYEVVGKKTVGIGSVDSVQILPRDIIISALRFNASYVIMAHNHPSGNPTPSTEDIQVSKRVQNALEIVGMELLDNLVITKDSWQRIDLLWCDIEEKSFRKEFRVFIDSNIPNNGFDDSVEVLIKAHQCFGRSSEVEQELLFEISNLVHFAKQTNLNALYLFRFPVDLSFDEKEVALFGKFYELFNDPVLFQRFLSIAQSYGEFRIETESELAFNRYYFGFSKVD